MQRIRKAGYRAPNISFFVPSLAEELNERDANQSRQEEARWQPRWTILFSLGAGAALWAGIFWLVRSVG